MVLTVDLIRTELHRRRCDDPGEERKKRAGRQCVISAPCDRLGSSSGFRDWPPPGDNGDGGGDGLARIQRKRNAQSDCFQFQGRPPVARAAKGVFK